MSDERARTHLAWLIWCFGQGYVKAEDRAILTNWVEEEPDADLLAMADEILSLLDRDTGG